MHKFHVGQTVVYRSRNAPPGACVVTAKLPERNGEYEYCVRNSAEPNERLAREGELQAIGLKVLSDGRQRGSTSGFSRGHSRRQRAAEGLNGGSG